MIFYINTTWNCFVMSRLLMFVYRKNTFASLNQTILKLWISAGNKQSCINMLQTIAVTYMGF